MEKVKNATLPPEVQKIATALFAKSAIAEILALPKAEIQKDKAYATAQVAARFPIRTYFAFHTTNYWVYVSFQPIPEFNDWAWKGKRA